MKWIKVEDQLPPVDTEVLLYVKYCTEGPIQGYLSDKNIFHGSFDVRDMMEDYFVGSSILLNQEFISHWMPLPNPPEHD